MLKKIRLQPSDFLIILLLFHLVGNVIWMKLNNAPPAWDEAEHIRYSLYFKSHLENFSKGNFVNLSNFINLFNFTYRPFIRLFTAIILIILIPSIKIAQSVGTLFFILAIISIYSFTKVVSKDEWVASVSAFIFSFYQAVYGYSRGLLLDLALTSFVVFSYYFLFKSMFFKNLKYTFLFFITSSLVVFTKSQGFIFLIFPIVYAFVWNLKREKKVYFKNFFIASLALLPVFLWFLFNFKEMSQYYQFGIRPELDDPTILQNITTWFHYLKLFINFQITPLFFLCFVFLLPLFLKSKVNHKYFIVLNLIFYYIFFTIIPNKDMRYLFPSLSVFTAIIFAISLCGLKEKYKLKGEILLWIIIFFNIFMYLSLSFGLFATKSIRKQVNLPKLGEIIYINFTDYPVKKFDPYEWPNEQIVKYLGGLRRDTVEVISSIDTEKINISNLELYKVLNNVTKVNFINPFAIKEFKSDDELFTYIKQFDYVMAADRNINPEYLLNIKALKQTGEYVLKTDKATLEKTYYLPNKIKLYIFGIKKEPPFRGP